ncbi:MAG: EAL domain-containing protein [Acidimicrobiales bacterium]
MTHLPNRKACLEKLHEALARTDSSRSDVAVIFIDLDGFKVVNDQFGHPAGDVVLETTSQRLLSCVRSSDLVGRLGGDEFVVIVDPVGGIDEVQALAERLLDAIGQPISIGKATVRVGGSLGIAMADDPEASGDDLLRDADLAVYRAKANGRNQVVVCDDELRSVVVRQNELDVAIRSAIADDELSLYYQPIVDPLTEQQVGLEALIRWFRPGGDMMPPDSFIPFAERSDLIVEIDSWVVDRVARQMAAWRSEGVDHLVPVSINISGRHLSVDAFVDDVMAPLERYGIDPALIVIEVTESALLDDLGGAAAKLQSLRDRGVRIAIDDFGTGYTSLAHLKTLPIDILKIDQSFTSDDSASSLVKLIIDTGHLLGVSITAEGIETADQAHALSSMGSDDLQGYYYGRPCPPEDITHHFPSALEDR